MQGMRGVLRDGLGRTLRALDEGDRIAAAWTVVCGHTLAERSSVVEFVDGFLRVAVADGTWMRQMESVRDHLKSELTLVAGVRVNGIHFELKRSQYEKKGEEDERTSRRNGS